MNTQEAASALILNKDGELLLTQRRDEPQAGRWAPPGGSVECGESPAQAARREVFEETGLKVRIGALATKVQVPVDTEQQFLVFSFWVEDYWGQLQAGDDALALIWADRDQLNALPLVAGLTDTLSGLGLL